MKLDETAGMMPVEDLNPWEKNPRNNEGAVNSVAMSIRDLGFGAPLVVQKKGLRVIAGHTRLKAAKQLGMKEVPVRLMDIDDEKAQTLALADNKLGEIADWNNDLLTELHAELGDENFELAGFDDLWNEQEKDEEPPADVAPEPPEDPVTKNGDCWLLGNHRLICGDSTDPSTVFRALDSKTADAVVTDPPYGVDYESKAGKVHNDGADQLEQLLDGSLGNAFANCKDGGIWYIFAPAGPNFLPFAKKLTELKIFRQSMVWVKSVLVLGHSDFHYRNEYIFYGWKPGAAHKEPPDRKNDSVWEFDKPGHNKIHPTMKPVAMVVKMLELSTDKGDLIFEPFGGSGTTLMAAEYTGRRCGCIEWSAAYCDAIVQRWEEHTGKKAVKE